MSQFLVAFILVKCLTNRTGIFNKNCHSLTKFDYFNGEKRQLRYTIVFLISNKNTKESYKRFHKEKEYPQTRMTQCWLVSLYRLLLY